MVLFSSLQVQPEKGSTSCTYDWLIGQSGVFLENQQEQQQHQQIQVLDSYLGVGT